MNITTEVVPGLLVLLVLTMELPSITNVTRNKMDAIVPSLIQETSVLSDVSCLTLL